ncbi:MAG: hypothetical protein ACE5F1_12235 [Planctomycetota bacterium]
MNESQESELNGEGDTRGSEAEWAIDIDFDELPQVNEYRSVPPGTYLCRIEEARPGTTRGGDQLLALKYVIHRGPETGRFAAWDNLVFSARAAGRARLVLAGLGLPHRGRVHVTAADIVGRTAWITLVENTYRNPVSGQVTKRNQVAFNGVRPADAEASDPAGGDIPF